MHLNGNNHVHFSISLNAVSEMSKSFFLNLLGIVVFFSKMHNFFFNLNGSVIQAVNLSNMV